MTDPHELAMKLAEKAAIVARAKIDYDDIKSLVPKIAAIFEPEMRRIQAEAKAKQQDSLILSAIRSEVFDYPDSLEHGCPACGWFEAHKPECLIARIRDEVKLIHKLQQEIGALKLDNTQLKELNKLNTEALRQQIERLAEALPALISDAWHHGYSDGLTDGASYPSQQDIDAILKRAALAEVGKV